MNVLPIFYFKTQENRQRSHSQQHNRQLRKVQLVKNTNLEVQIHKEVKPTAALNDYVFLLIYSRFKIATMISKTAGMKVKLYVTTLHETKKSVETVAVKT